MADDDGVGEGRCAAQLVACACGRRLEAAKTSLPLACFRAIRSIISQIASGAQATFFPAKPLYRQAKSSKQFAKTARQKTFGIRSKVSRCTVLLEPLSLVVQPAKKSSFIFSLALLPAAAQQARLGPARPPRGCRQARPPLRRRQYCNKKQKKILCNNVFPTPNGKRRY